jgi:hypothetical protein
MATCPGGPPVANEPTPNAGVTVTPNVPQPIYSSNAADPFPQVAWTPTDEYCSLQFSITPGNELIVPSTQWNVNWQNEDLTNGTDAAGNAAIAAGFGVAPLSSTPITGPASSGPIVVGSNTVTISILSGTVRVSMGNGSLFGYNPGDPVSDAVIRYEWATPVHNLVHAYFDSGSDQTPVGITDYQTALAVDDPIMSNCQMEPRGRNGVLALIDVDTANGNLNDADFNNIEGEYSIDGGGSWLPVPSPNDSLTPSGDILVPTQIPFWSGEVVWPLDAGQSVMYRFHFLVNSNIVETLTCGPINTSLYPTVGCQVINITTTSADVPFVNTAPGGEFNTFPAGANDPANSDTLRVVYGTTPGGPYPFTETVEASVTNQVPLTGLTPNTQYYFRMQADEDFQTGTQFLDFGECTFTTLANTPFVNSQPASNITQTSADANGDADNIPVNEFIRISYGPTGGPYSNVGPNVAGTNALGQPITRPLAGLTPGTQYCYVVEHIAADGTTVLQTSPETCFTTLAPATVAPECNPATFIQFDQADLQGTVDGMAANDYAVIEYGTTPGGPYPTKSGSTPGDTTIGQLIPPVPFTASPLTPGTYYYRVGVYDDPGATILLEASSECSFTIPASTVDCGTASNPTATTIDITATAHNVLPNWIILWEFATTSGGPYTQAFGANGDGTPNQALNETFGVLTPNTTYFYRWTVFDQIANEVFAGPECDSFTTLADREAVCDPATSVDTDSATLNGTLSGLVPGDQYRFRYGTVPGGPYGTTLGPFPAANGPVSAPTGAVLAPGTTYYYILEVWDGFNVQATSGECSLATAPPPLVDPCEAATNVTPFSATLNGTATNVPAGYTRRFRYGTAPGVYTNTVPAGVFSGASPEAYSANIAGLTPGTQYYYTSEVLDPGLNVVAESPVECTFVTQTLEEGGIVSWCGAFYDSGQCIFVPTNSGGYFYCAGAEAIDE